MQKGSLSKVYGTTLSNFSFNSKPLRFYKVYLPERPKGLVWVEKQEWQRNFKDSIQENKNLYNERQSQIEDDYIEKFERNQYKKMLNDELKLRTQTIKISWQTHEWVISQKELQERRRNTLRKFYVDKEIQQKNRSRIRKPTSQLFLTQKSQFDGGR